MALTKVNQNMVTGFTPKAHHSLSVINAPQAALQRFNLTKQGTGSGNVIQDSAQNTIANVHQIDGADIRISGWFKV